MASMRNGIIKRGATWSYVVRLPDPATGKTRPKWFGGFATAKDAKQARDRAQSRIHDGMHVEPSRLTVGEYLRDRWLPAIEATGKRATTVRSYHLHIGTHIAP